MLGMYLELQARSLSLDHLSERTKNIPLWNFCFGVMPNMNGGGRAAVEPRLNVFQRVTMPRVARPFSLGIRAGRV